MEVLEKGIYQYSMNGNLIAKYENIKDITIKKQYLATTICNAIAGRTKTAYGYKWINTKKYFFNFRSKQIVDIVIKKTGIKHDLLIAKGRNKEIIRARQLAHYLLKQETNLTLTQIGLLTGGQDHSTISYSCKKISGYLDINDADIKYYVASCQEEIDKIRNFYFKQWIPIYDHSKI